MFSLICAWINRWVNNREAGNLRCHRAHYNVTVMLTCHGVIMHWYKMFSCAVMTRAPSQYPKRRIFVRSRKVSKPRDWYFILSYRFEIWQAHRQHCCRSAYQISERYDNSKYKSRDIGFETLRDLTERRLFGYWDGALCPTQRYGERPECPAIKKKSKLLCLCLYTYIVISCDM